MFFSFCLFTLLIVLLIFLTHLFICLFIFDIRSHYCIPSCYIEAKVRFLCACTDLIEKEARRELSKKRNVLTVSIESYVRHAALLSHAVFRS